MLNTVLALGLLVFTCATIRADQSSAQIITNGKSLLASGDTAGALDKFRQAANKGDAQAAWLAGDLLFTQAGQATGRDRVEKSIESGYYLFAAATNHQARACADLSRAFRNGMGVQTNLIYAYAWLDYAAHLDPTYRADLDGFVLQLDPAQIQQAQACTKDMQAGHWPNFNFHHVTREDPRIRVQGFAAGSHGPLVILNGSTFARGESGNVEPANVPRSTFTPRINITCLDIGDDYVLLSIAGEPALRLLSMPASDRR